MKTEVLLRSIGKINDELIADAESEANTKRKPGWAKLGTMVACLALVLCTGIATQAIRSNATAGTFTMDVNPSVEYTIAKSGIVKNVRCLNSDAENALSDVALGKQSVETALTRTVAAYEACGYMENGEATVLISFDSRLDANAELKASLSAEIRKALEQTDAVGTLVFHSELTENAEVAKIAEEFHVSLGRADWILTAANKTGLPTDEVARMSLDELLKFQEVSGISWALHTGSGQWRQPTHFLRWSAPQSLPKERRLPAQTARGLLVRVRVFRQYTAYNGSERGCA